jgi:hypothetical protein
MSQGDVPPTPLFERILATQNDPDDTEVYLAYFRFPDRTTMTRCLAPLGLGDEPSPSPVSFARVGRVMQLRGLDFILRYKPEGGNRRLYPEDAEFVRAIEQALAGLEVCGFRLPFPPPSGAP